MDSVSVSIPTISSTTTEESSTTQSSTTPTQSSTTQASSTTASSTVNPGVTRSSSPAASSSSSESTSLSTSTSVVVITRETTISGSVSSVVESSTISSVIPTTGQQNNGGGGLSTGAKTGIIAACSSVGGIAILAILGFLFYRCYRRRRSEYTPGAEEIKWPDAPEDAGALFPAAARSTGSHGLGRETSMRSVGTSAYQPSTAGIGSSSGHTAYPAYNNAQPTIPEGDYYDPNAAYFAGGGAAAAGVGAGAAAYGASQRRSLPIPPTQEQRYSNYGESYENAYNYNAEEPGHSDASSPEQYPDDDDVPISYQQRSGPLGVANPS